jgi:hypothetical protein
MKAVSDVPWSAKTDRLAEPTRCSVRSKGSSRFEGSSRSMGSRVDCMSGSRALTLPARPRANAAGDGPVPGNCAAREEELLVGM